MRVIGFRFEFWVELHCDVEGMVGDFYDFDEALVFGNGGNNESCFFEFLAVSWVELVTMAVAFVDGLGAVVEFVRFGVAEEDGFT